MIIILDDLLTRVECNILIDIYKNNTKLADIWPRGCEEGCSHPINAMTLNNYFLFTILQRIEEKSQQYFGNDKIIEWGELKKNDHGYKHPMHYDEASKDTVLASITYLNNDYSGGHTIFEDTTTSKGEHITSIAPVPGRTIIFDGMRYRHGASINSDAPRYTIPIWYKKR